MRNLFHPQGPLIGLGMASLVLGVISLLLAFLPILGIPISAFGLIFGIVGTSVALFARGTSLRWSLGGLAICALALGVNLAIDYAPVNQFRDYRNPRPWQPPPDRPLVPPPASDPY